MIPLGKKYCQAVRHTTPSPRQKRPCRAIREIQLLHPSGISGCSSSTGSWSCVPSHSSAAHHHSSFPLTHHKYLLLLLPTCCLLQGWHSRKKQGLSDSTSEVLWCPHPVADHKEQLHHDRNGVKADTSDPHGFLFLRRGCWHVPCGPATPANCHSSSDSRFFGCPVTLSSVTQGYQQSQKNVAEGRLRD